MSDTPTLRQRLDVEVSRWAIQTELGHAGRVAEVAIDIFGMISACGDFPDSMPIRWVYRLGHRTRFITVDRKSRTIAFDDGLDLDERGQERRKQ